MFLRRLFAFVLVVAFLFSLFGVPVGAEPDPSETGIDQLGIPVDTIPDSPESAKAEARNYLVKEWGAVLRENQFFNSFLLFLESTSPVTVPASKILFGIEPAISWFFLLVVVLWFTFWGYVFWGLELSSPFSRWTNFIMSLAGTILFGSVGFFREVGNAIVSLLRLATIWWVQMIFILIILVGLAFASRFSHVLRKAARKRKEADAKFEETLDREKLKGTVKVAETFVKGVIDN